VKHTIWICIAWPALKPVGPQDRNPITKRLECRKPITEKRALAQFKKDFPGLRNYTAQPGGEAAQ
jgi:hypothetical protein